ncbi:serine/threonine-protein kinase ULK4 [Ciona intestinalis]
MENFVLYEEIGRETSSIVYKGRRRGTINFLAIQCIEKDRRAAITNWVRLTHEFNHQNIVQFHEWYETSNHLWMVTELCTGGTLDEVLRQDSCLPGAIVCQFGKDIIRGLSYLHEHSVVFADLCPKNVLLDGPGVLKLTNFCLSRLVDEDLNEVYLQAANKMDDSDSMSIDNDNLLGELHYRSPEVLKGGNPTTNSDIWAFGVLLYRMYSGAVPFSGNEDNFISQVLQNDFLDPQQQRNKLHYHNAHVLSDGQISDDFQHLLSKTLEKDQNVRFNSKQALNHKLWNIIEEADITMDESGADSFNVAEDSLRDTVSSLSFAPESVNVLDSTFTLSSRPRTANHRESEKVVKNSTAKSGPINNSNIQVQSIDKTMTFSQTLDLERDSLSICEPEIQQESDVTFEDIQNVIYCDTEPKECIIQDNTQIKKTEQLRWDAKTIPFKLLSQVHNTTPDELYSHLKLIVDLFTQQSASNNSQSRLKANVLSYLSHLCVANSEVSNFVVNSNLLLLMVNLCKNSMQQFPDMAFKAIRTIGLAARSATELQQCTQVTEVFNVLSEILREGFKHDRIKFSIVPALGQLLCLVATHEDSLLATTDGRATSSESHGQRKGNWYIPGATYTLITRCLHEGEDSALQHYACKIIECVACVSDQHGRKFISISPQSSGGSSHSRDVIGPLLWSTSDKAKSEGIRSTSLMALCSLNRISGSGSIFQAVLERAGVQSVLIFLTRSSYKCQQAILTSFNETLNSGQKGHSVRLANAKDILPSIMKLLDSPSNLVRAKVNLSLLLLLRLNPKLLMTACQHRLIMHIERDCRKISPSHFARPLHVQHVSEEDKYIHSTLCLLIRYMILQSKEVTSSSIDALNEAMERKHPSSKQVKQLRISLPCCMLLQNLITSHVFRMQMVTENFIENVGKLLDHVVKFVKKAPASSAGIVTAIGDDTAQKFIDTTLSIIEVLSQHPPDLANNEEASMKCLVPRLVILCTVSDSNERQAGCVKLLTDVLDTLLHFRAISTDASTVTLTNERNSIKTPASRLSSRATVRHEMPDEFGIRECVIVNIIPEFQSILLHQMPLPAYGVRLLSILLEHWPSISTSLCYYGVIPILFKLLDEHKSSPLSSSYQGIITIFTYLIQYRNIDVVNALYNNGLVETVNTCLLENFSFYRQVRKNSDDDGAVDCLSHNLSLLKYMLDRVTTAVKEALLAKEESNSTRPNTTEGAERLLVLHKPLTDLHTVCISLLCEEKELSDSALACLSLLVQLYGGDHPDTMLTKNMNSLAAALTVANPKNQRILLKLIRRIATLNVHHAHRLASEDGGLLIENVRNTLHAAEQCADSSLAHLANEILVSIKDKRKE